MSTALMIGGMFGALVGLIHAISIFALKLRWGDGVVDSPRRGRWIGAAYFAICTAALWTLFGSYILYLWLGSLVIFALCLPFRATVQSHAPE